MRTMNENWFPQRTDILLRQFTSRGLYPDVAAPQFSQHGGDVLAGTALQISADQEGTIYYTLDGSDPRATGGQVNRPGEITHEFNTAIELNADTLIKARVQLGGTWSALTEAQFTIGTPGDLNQDGTVDVEDVDHLCAALRSGDASADLNSDGELNQDDMSFLIQNLLHTGFGDANLDRVFGSGDLVQVFQLGEYDDGISGNSTWASGDWNCDGEFDSVDLVLAFQMNVYSTAADKQLRSSTV